MKFRIKVITKLSTNGAFADRERERGILPKILRSLLKCENSVSKIPRIVNDSISKEDFAVVHDKFKKNCVKNNS